jgi:hypothetical protein
MKTPKPVPGPLPVEPRLLRRQIAQAKADARAAAAAAETAKANFKQAKKAHKQAKKAAKRARKDLKALLTQQKGARPRRPAKSRPSGKTTLVLRNVTSVAVPPAALALAVGGASMPTAPETRPSGAPPAADGGA